MIDELERLATRAEGARQFAAARAALRDIAELRGFLKAPEEKKLEPPPEEKRRLICEAAEVYGMVWPKEGQ
jgi:hypothetical protein